MTLDMIIRNGLVIDGTGRPGSTCDIAVEKGRIVDIGRIGVTAPSEIDAAGRVVAPGFIDIHTHYDAQVFWDRAVSPSSFHGVTTVIAGNCGFSIAPLNDNPEDAAYLMRMLARVEGMPLESLKTGVPWDWTSFGDFLSRLDGQLAINAGFMVGHSALRRCIMGPRAVGEKASDTDLEGMKALLRESLRAGGLGFSTTVSETHNDGEGDPVPSRHASDEEILALARVVSEFEGTSVEFLPNILDRFSEAEMERLAQVSLAAGRPVNWNVLLPDSSAPDRMKSQLAASDYAIARGAKVYALAACEPPVGRLNFIAGFGLDSLPGWSGLFKLSRADRLRALNDPLVRTLLFEGARQAKGIMQRFAQWGRWTIAETFSDAYKRFEGEDLETLGASLGKMPFEAMLDLVLADELRTSLTPPVVGTDDASWALRGEAWRDERTIIGASDAGAHVDMIATFAFSTTVLGEGVRKRKLLTLEEAIRQLTSVPAGYLGLRDRGVITKGALADLVIFDPAAVACGKVHLRFDLPAGAGRLYAEAEGISHVIVNGVEIIRNNELLGTFPGRILRSGVDTQTVSIPNTKSPEA